MTVKKVERNVLPMANALRKSDFGRAASLDKQTSKEFVWDDDLPPAENYELLGRLLAECPDVFRHAEYGSGLVMVRPAGDITPIAINTPRQLAAMLVDRVRIDLRKDGKHMGHSIPSRELGKMLLSEAFLGQLRPIDRVVYQPMYLKNFSLTQRGYNDAGPGERILYVGDEPRADRECKTIERFLDVMDFASNADRTNCLAAALTVLLRNHFLGGKPLLLFDATKSHAGKDTGVAMAVGFEKMISVSYQTTDWALERSIVGALKHSPDLGVVKNDNARCGPKGQIIASAFLERFLTSEKLFLFSTGTGAPVTRANDVVVAISTNEGRLSPDLLNRSLPVHLAPVGSIHDRTSPLGDLKCEFLPANRAQIAAELRGLVENWKEAGRPVSTKVKHPFKAWAETVGGILEVAGYTDFLANFALRRTVGDPVSEGLGILGAYDWRQAMKNPDAAWQRPDHWVGLVDTLGLCERLIGRQDWPTVDSRKRGLGQTFTNHVDETFHALTDDARLVLRLEKTRRRNRGEPVVMYRFAVVRHEWVDAGTDVNDTGDESDGGHGNREDAAGRLRIAGSEKSSPIEQGIPGGFESHELDDGHLLYQGSVPAELRPDEGAFDKLWALHPAEHNLLVIHGRELPAPRWQQPYLRDYAYSGVNNTALPLPDVLQPIYDWCRKAIDDRLNGVLGNWYRDGAHYIGPHHDKSTNLIYGTPIVTVSFGEQRTFRLRHPKQKYVRDFTVGDGTIFVMPYMTNKTWKHEVPRSTKVQGRRVSITLRAFQD